MLELVDISPQPPERFESVLEPELFERLAAGIRASRELLEGRVVWHVNSTAKGGGVVELLRPLLGYEQGAGVDTRWAVIQGEPEFFRMTKRIHNNLHGFEGDGGPLGDAEREAYERALQDNADDLAGAIEARDVVFLHDPQTAGLVERVKQTGAKVVWRCHIGLDVPNELARRAWGFLEPHVREADAYVFSRKAFVWEGLDDDKINVIAPSIDAFSPKNQQLDAATVTAVLAAAGILDGADPSGATFARGDGSEARVEHAAELFEDQRLRADDRIVLQVSRWDRLKDPRGVIEGFAEHGVVQTGAHLVYAGPAVEAVSDDPEGAEVLEESIALRERLPEQTRRHVHLVALPMDDSEENAVIVNALQRQAAVVVQKSIAEGFGLTVAEAMWKARPVVGSRVGGIQDQIVDGESGVLVDPYDLEAYGRAVRELLEDAGRAERIGRAAQQRVRGGFLGARSLLDYLELIRRLLR